jgi:hypothetical protein
VHHAHDPGQVQFVTKPHVESGAEAKVLLEVKTADLGPDNRAYVHAYDAKGHVADLPLEWTKSVENGGADVFAGTVSVSALQAKGFEPSSTSLQPWVLYAGQSEARWGEAIPFDLGALAAAASAQTPVERALGNVVAGPLATPAAAVSDGSAPSSAAADGGWLASLPRPTSLSENVGKLDQLGREDQGALLLVGGQLARSQSVRVTAVKHPSLGRGTEVMLQLLPEASVALEQRLKDEGIQKVPIFVDDAGYDSVERISLVGNPKPLVVPDVGGQAPTKAFRLEEPGAYVLEFLGEKDVPKAYRGAVRLRAYGATSEERLEQVSKAAKRIRLEGLLAPADPAFSRKVIAQSVMSHVNPQAADAVLAKLGSLSVEEVEAKAAGVGITGERLREAQIKEVFPGHAAVVDPQLGDLYAEAGVKGVFVGVREIASVPLILASDGLMSYAERTSRGLFRQGASNRNDELSGGARSAFTRAVTPRAFKGSGQIQHSYGAGRVQLLSTGTGLRHLLSRADWYGYPADLYGVKIAADEVQTDPALANHSRGGAYSNRLAGRALVEAIEGGPSGHQFAQFQHQNELCFECGVANVWTHAVVQDEGAKAALIKALTDAGFQDFNGRPFDQAIVVATRWAEVRNSLVAQGVSDWAPSP